MSYYRLKPNLVKDVSEHTLEALKVCKHTREMTTVAAASFIFANMHLRVGLASTPKHSLVELFALGRCGCALNNVSDEIRLKLVVHLGPHMRFCCLATPVQMLLQKLVGMLSENYENYLSFFMVQLQPIS